MPASVPAKVNEPFKVLTQGKKITIQSKPKLKKIMIWTASGHRIVEDHNLDQHSWTFNINVNENVFYLMLELADGKRYTKKIGITH